MSKAFGFTVFLIHAGDERRLLVLEQELAKRL